MGKVTQKKNHVNYCTQELTGILLFSEVTFVPDEETYTIISRWNQSNFREKKCLREYITEYHPMGYMRA